MKSNNNSGLARWGSLAALMLLLTAAHLVSGATSIKSNSNSNSNSNDKQLKNQFNDESHSLTKHEATKHQSALALSSEKPTNQQQTASNQSPANQEPALSSSSSSGGSSAAAQPAAEKKQGDFVVQDLFGADEYVQIKPEEITVNENGKEIVAGQTDAQSLSEQQQQQQQQPMNNGAAANAEHKSADDELNAHLALDSISQQESAAYNSYSPLVQARGPPTPRAAYQSAPLAMAPPAPAHAGPYKAAPRPLPPMAGGPYQVPSLPMENGHRPNRSPQRLPPSYITMKGKLTGINSIISQYPHPAPGYPHQGPRHLPRGAAAGYAAFRDFVRAHASKYKHATPATSNAPIGYNSAPQLDPTRYERPKDPATDYKPAPQAAYGGSAGGQVKRAPVKTKVTLAQAYIPHLSSQNSAAAYGGGANQASGAGAYAQANPVLAKLYGNHAPQGDGKPEYSKDYGMVIHYPQATVYTEPMTVEQLHKLTGAGISQVLEQLQYNFAHGQRDESNTLRANNKHHLGHGITIHAKEYYAPGKGGQYVPTTAAVISTGAQQQQQQSYASKPSSAAYEDSQSAGYEAPPAPEQPQMSSYGTNGKSSAGELGSGYERVRQAANSSNQKYNNKQSNYAAPSSAYQQQAPQAQPQQAPASYEQPSANRYGNGEPLSAITSFIGSELDALYKANAALTKQLEPEIYAGIQAHRASGKANGPLRYSEIPQIPYQQQQQGNSYSAPSGAPGYRQQQVGGQYNQYTGQQQQQMGYKQQQQQQHQYQQRPANHQRRPSGNGNRNRHYRQSQRPQQSGAYNRQPAQQGYENRPQANSYQQQAAYQTAERSLEQQMMQLLQDFRNGDEQYNTKSQPSHSINQGYPNKIMQKYNQQQQQQQQQYQQQQQQQHQQPAAYGNNQQNNQQALPYAHHDGLEIPQGPNDQIGEIADLIEALKGSLDLQKPEPAAGDSYANAPAKQGPKQLEDVKYLTSALGQVPSYSIQVPVASGESNGAYEQAAKKDAGDSGYQHQDSRPYSNKPASAAASYQGAEGAYGANQNYGGQQQAQQGAGQQQQQQAASGYQQPASSYQLPAANYQQPEAGYQQAQPEYQQQQQQQQQHQQQQQQQQPQPQQTDYQPSSQAGGDYGAPQHQPQVASYAQSAPTSQAAEQAPASGYSVNEHSQIINHLVPATSSSAGQPAQSGYSQPLAAGQSHQQAAVSQIAIAAPTESQYQQAQSLSSFVDSLSTDYQELLRQPAPGLLEPQHNGVATQLVLQPANQAAADSSGYNSSATAPTSAAYDTVAAASSQQVATSTGAAQVTAGKQSGYQQAQPTKSHSTSANSSNNAQQQQQYRKAA